jgi:proteasome component ECM29
MNLASHHAIWNSKKGAAFAAVSLASKEEASKAMTAFLPSLVPRLYRSSYDPNPRIAHAMGEVRCLPRISRKQF